MSRRSRRRVTRAYIPPLRFDISETGQIWMPLLNPCGTDRSVEEWPTLALPQTKIVGADRESVEQTAAGGDLTDLRLSDGTELYGYHTRVERFDYALTPVPTLTLVLPSMTATGPSCTVRFVDAIVTDWTTAKEYEPDDPNHELCELTWDGAQSFLLEFFAFKILVRAVRLELEPVGDPSD